MSQFGFDKTVSGKDFVGRQAELHSFRNLLEQGENIAIYDAPKSGKKSFIRQAFLNMKNAGSQFVAVEFSLLAVRSLEDFSIRFGSSLLSTFGSTHADHANNLSALLLGTHFVFDPDLYAKEGNVLSSNWALDRDDLKSILELPYRLSSKYSQRLIIVFHEFQNIMLTEDGDAFCHILEDVIRAHKETQSKAVQFVFCGSQINAMKDIFAIRKFFFRQVNILPLGQIDTKELIDHAVKGFLATGKVLDKELMLGVCKLFRNHICYIEQFCFICNAISRGYVMEPILIEALKSMIAIYAPHFRMQINDLTTFQLNLLKAILDGHVKFSSSEVIKSYSLNSSANVRRLKDALIKKEIITFDNNDTPSFIDPLFEYWIREYYFVVNSK